MKKCEFIRRATKNGVHKELAKVYVRKIGKRGYDKADLDTLARMARNTERGLWKNGPRHYRGQMTPAKEFEQVFDQLFMEAKPLQGEDRIQSENLKAVNAYVKAHPFYCGSRAPTYIRDENMKLVPNPDRLVGCRK